MDNQALVDALIKFQSWCDNWPKIRAEIDAQAAEIAALRARLAEAVLDLEQIVCTKEPDDGVVLLSNDGSAHYDPETKCQVYDHEHFSPLGDALIALHKKLTTAGEDVR